MPSKILKDFQIRRKKAETSLKGEKGFEAMLKLVKDFSKLETTIGALDKAIDANDAAKARTALADFLRLSGLYRGKIAAELTKIKKKGGGAEDTDAFADTTTLLAQLLTEEQHTPQKVQGLASQGRTTTSSKSLPCTASGSASRRFSRPRPGRRSPASGSSRGSA